MRVGRNEGLEDLEPFGQQDLLGQMKKYREELKAVGIPVRFDGTIVIGSKEGYERYLESISAADIRRLQTITRGERGPVLDLTRGPVPGVFLVHDRGDPEEGRSAGFKIMGLPPRPEPRILVSFAMTRK